MTEDELTFSNFRRILAENDWPREVLMDKEDFALFIGKLGGVDQGFDDRGPYLLFDGCHVRPKILQRLDLLDLSSDSTGQKRKLRGNETSTARE